MYIDRNTNEPAFALCIPLVNLTTEQHIPVRLVDPKAGSAHTNSPWASWSPQGRRFVGVACTGMYITDMSKHLAETFTDFGDHGVYVRDADGDLVAASLASKEAYFDSAAGVNASSVVRLRVPAPDAPASALAPALAPAPTHARVSAAGHAGRMRVVGAR